MAGARSMARLVAEESRRKENGRKKDAVKEERNAILDCSLKKLILNDEHCRT